MKRAHAIIVRPLLKLVPIMLRNLARNRRRNLLTMLSIAGSLFIFSALASLPDVINQITLTNSSQRLVCANKASIFYPLPQSYRRRILALPHVKAAVGETYFGGMYQGAHDQLAATSLDIDQLADVYPDFEIDAPTLAALKRERRACLASVGVMRLHHWRVGDRITLKGTIYPIDVQVQIVGTLGHKYPTMIMMRRDYLEEILPDKGRVNNFWIRIDNPRLAPSVMRPSTRPSPTPRSKPTPRPRRASFRASSEWWDRYANARSRIQTSALRDIFLD